MADDDEDDLWGDFNEDECNSSVAMSANLLEVTGIQTSQDSTVHKGEADEGQLTWEAPTFSGLDNSTAVDAGTHWYKEPTPGATPTTAAAMAMTGPAAGQMDWSAVTLKPAAGGGIDWSAFVQQQPAAQK